MPVLALAPESAEADRLSRPLWSLEAITDRPTLGVLALCLNQQCQVAVRDDPLRSRGIEAGVVRGDRGQTIDVAVEHTERGRDQNGVVDLRIRCALRAGCSHILRGDIQAALLYCGGDPKQGLQLG